MNDDAQNNKAEIFSYIIYLSNVLFLPTQILIY